MQKPNKGRITNVRRVEIPEQSARKYGDNLGWLFTCTFIDHPHFSGTSGHTSLAVDYDESTGRLETLNSIYQVVKNDEQEATD